MTANTSLTLRNAFSAGLVVALLGTLGLVAIGFFDSSAHAQDGTDPVFSADITTDLTDNQQVTLTGSGFIPFSRLWFHQCVDGSDYACTGLGFDSAEDDGTFARVVKVDRLLFHGKTGETFDCSVAACHIKMGGDRGRPDPLPISFDGSITPPAPPASIAVPGNGALTDGQEIIVEIADKNVVTGYIRQCHLTTEGSTTDCARIAIGQRDVSPSEYKVRLRRFLVPDDEAGLLIDCTIDDCVVSFFRNKTRQDIIGPVLVFDAEADLLAPVVQVDKTVNITPSDKIAVTVSNSLDEVVTVLQCPRRADSSDDERCKQLGERIRSDRKLAISIEPFTISVDPVRALAAKGKKRVDCARARACVLRVETNRGESESVDIRFVTPKKNDDVHVRVRPRRNLLDGARVSVQIRNAPAGDLGVVQCPTADAELSRCEEAPSVELKANKQITVFKSAVQRTVGDVDCARVARCELRIISEGATIGSNRITFSRSPTTISVSPDSDLGDGDRVEIVLPSSNEPVRVWQCSSAVYPANFPEFCTELPVENVEEAIDFRTVAVQVAAMIDDMTCAGQYARCSLFLQIGDQLIEKQLFLHFDPTLQPERNSSVTPRVGLRDGDTVTIVADQPGTRPNNTFLSQCGLYEGKMIVGTCKGLGLRTSGTYEVQVQQILAIENADTTWDCAAQPKSCAIFVIRESSTSKFTLSFEP